MTLRELLHALEHCRSSSALRNDHDDWFDQCEELMPLCYYWVITAAYHDGATADIICSMVILVNTAASRDKNCPVFNPKWIITLDLKWVQRCCTKMASTAPVPKWGELSLSGHEAVVLAAPNPSHNAKCSYWKSLSAVEPPKLFLSISSPKTKTTSVKDLCPITKKNAKCSHRDVTRW